MTDPILEAAAGRKSLGEKLCDAIHLPLMYTSRAPWSTLGLDSRGSYEVAALAFAASLTHDETAQASIDAARQEGRQSAGDRAITEAMVEAGAKAVGDELVGQELSGAFDDLGEDGSNRAIARACLEAALLSPQAAPVEQGEVTMLADQDWLARHVATDPDVCVEAGAPVRNTDRLPAKHLTDAELIVEQTRVEKLWDSLHEPDEDGEISGRGGSPGEWMVERMDEIATEQARRASALKGGDL